MWNYSEKSENVDMTQESMGLIADDKNLATAIVALSIGLNVIKILQGTPERITNS